MLTPIFSKVKINQVNDISATPKYQFAIPYHCHPNGVAVYDT